MTTTSIRVQETPLVAAVLRRADDALILGHRLSEWTGRAPMLEEEMALANQALDHFGLARALYAYAAGLEGQGHDEDQLAFLRDGPDYHNALLVELPNGDFAFTTVRALLYAAFAEPWWRAMAASSDATLASIAARTAKEVAYHARHAAEWVVRLGDGTDESHRRAQDALDALLPYADELFDPEDQDLVAAGVLVDPPTVREAWSGTVSAVVERSTLTWPPKVPAQRGGRAGRHTEHHSRLLVELQHLQRSHPGASW